MLEVTPFNKGFLVHTFTREEEWKEGMWWKNMKNSNKALQQTKTALRSFNINLSHSGLVLNQGLLPVVRARFWLLKASVSNSP